MQKQDPPHRDEKNYFYVEEKMNWTEARDNCLRHEAILAETKSSIEDAQLYTFTAHTFKVVNRLYTGNWAWVGATSTIKQDLLMLVEPTQVFGSNDFTDSGKSEPSTVTRTNCPYVGRSIQNYRKSIFMSYVTGYSNNCTHKLPSICQKM